MIFKNSCLALTLALFVPVSRAAILTVTNADNVLSDGVTAAPGSLLEALQKVGSGDTIRFPIPGPGPHYLVTPIGGYPLITSDEILRSGAGNMESNGVAAPHFLQRLQQTSRRGGDA